MVYIDRVEAEWPLRMQLPIGTRVPLHCTASGKLFLSSLPPAMRGAVLRSLTLEARTARSFTDPEALGAALEDIRGSQVGTDNQEFLDGMVAVAVPVTDSAGRFFAALAVHAPVMRMNLDEMMTHVPVLREAAAGLSELAVTPSAVNATD
jgi:DNA-binding IclR family transcriptional regulator